LEAAAQRRHHFLQVPASRGIPHSPELLLLPSHLGSKQSNQTLQDSMLLGELMLCLGYAV
jgi:hypothetical protein